MFLTLCLSLQNKSYISKYLYFIESCRYVLLKERNMLFTMEAAAKRRYEIFPNPERIDKVELSMENLEAVVKERNKAYNLLEIGETGERPAKIVRNAIG